jgi:nucleoside-diphosphate-sugar epimerase
MPPLVLLTGAYGFIASHCLLQLLEQGYRVRGALRNLAVHSEPLRQIVSQAGLSNDQLELVQLDLLEDRGWEQAAQGCEYILHVASPVGAVSRRQAEILVRPAQEGTLRVLKAAANAGVRRVVLTSSLAAIAEGHQDRRRQFDERDWTRLEGHPRSYAVSKTLAERAAWDFVKDLGAAQPVELAVINPGLVLGPLLDPRHTSSAEVLIRMLKRVYPGCPRLHWALVDVRDVAAAHLLAMTSPVAAGERFCCYTSLLWMVEIARILNDHLRGRRTPISERVLPDALVRLITLFDLQARDLRASLGVPRQLSNQKLQDVLGWHPRPIENTLIDTAESLIRFGLA